MNFKTSDFGSFFLIVGALLAVLYLPNGVLHRFIGSGIYGRDVLLGFHFMGICMYFIAIRQMRYFLRAAWPLIAILALVFCPLYNSRGNLRDLLILMKWGFMWIDWMALGWLVALRGSMPKLAKLLLIAGFCIICTDAAVGMYEEKTNQFFFPAEEAETSAGVTSARNNQLEGAIRVQGLQRDVFTFANFMGVGFTVCLTAIALKRKPAVTVFGGALAAFFGYVGFNSGGRSVFFGMILVLFLFILAFFYRRIFNRYAGNVMLTAIIAEGIMCLIGIGQTLLFLLNSLGWHATVLNLASSFERDEVWKERVNMMLDYPISIISGMPSAYYVSRAGDPIQFVDNLPLWAFYHFGIVGLVVLGVYFVRYGRHSMQKQEPMAYLAFMMFMALVWGEGLARDTFGMYSCLPMFGLAGFLAGKFAMEQRRLFLERHLRSAKVPTLVA